MNTMKDYERKLKLEALARIKDSIRTIMQETKTLFRKRPSKKQLLINAKKICEHFIENNYVLFGGKNIYTKKELLDSLRIFGNFNNRQINKLEKLFENYTDSDPYHITEGNLNSDMLGIEFYMDESEDERMKALEKGVKELIHERETEKYNRSKELTEILKNLNKLKGGE